MLDDQPRRCERLRVGAHGIDLVVVQKIHEVGDHFVGFVAVGKRQVHIPVEIHGRKAAKPTVGDGLQA